MQTPIGEGLGSSDALAPVAALSVDEGAPLTPAAVRGAGIIGGSGLDYSQTHAPSSALTEAEVQSPVVRPADLHKQELLQGPGLSAADLADDGRSEKFCRGRSPRHSVPLRRSIAGPGGARALIGSRR